ncbi:MAG: tetratricopeptide repeat protein [Chitinophagaceae bacterium]|nr:tetratricopeptide repeat protein [Chitinophagaceae bacterium]MBK8309878.1 tetratricopeptide repeat protein [Chitinophagaceae bacterium]MBP6476936.1 tetratricopeptide repeat protein [Chitinophagaceae bacterium]MBP7107960.1 tetratricopeptide repeat protein [Chitinophagaceae bacterium]MBP7314022.1 tetratricopeptide repeat protein [Chitinophagaceae bacterium]
MNKIPFILIGFLFGVNTFAQDVNEAIKAGNDFYKQQEYLKASAEYAKALEAEPSNITAKFNQANALFKLDKKVEAAVIYNDVVKMATDKSLLSKAWYNKGVILSNQQNLEESIEAYKNALRNNPDDKEARENLQKAMLELKKKEPPKKKDEDQKKKQNQQQKQNQSKMSMKEAEQRLKLLQQKEKEVQQRVQKEKVKGGGSQPKDW